MNRILAIAIAVGGTLALADPKPPPAFDQIEYRVDNLQRVMGHMVISSDGRIRLRAHRDGDEQDVPLPLGKDELIDEDLDKLREIVASIDWKNIKPRYAVEGRKPPRGAGVHTIIATVAGKRHETYVERLDKQGGPPETLAGLVWFLSVYEGMVLPEKLPTTTPPAEFQMVKWATSTDKFIEVRSDRSVCLNGETFKSAVSEEQLASLKMLTANVDWDELAKSSPAKPQSERTVTMTAGRRRYDIEVKPAEAPKPLATLADALERHARQFSAAKP